MVDAPEFEHLRDFSGEESEHMTELSCPACGHAVEMIDRRFLRFGPVRCGACGETLSSPVLARVLAGALDASSG